MEQTEQTCETEHKLAPHYAFHNEVMKEKTKNHPCYNGCNHENARIHLPVAPGCNIQCNYCVRKYDCVNESRPGVTTSILSPEEALERFIQMKKEIPKLSVVGIAGPGDALSDFENTKKTIRLIRAVAPEITFCLSTNGLMLPVYADEIVALGISHLTVTVNAVDPKISAKIYKYIRYEGMEFKDEMAGMILLRNQLAGLRMLTRKGIVCKINIVTLKGINDFHIPEIVKTMKEIGCYIINIMPFIPIPGSGFENLPKVTACEVNKLREECGEIMFQMHHCRQCRADAVGTL